MEFKSLFETRGESVCSESAAKLIKLFECRDNVDDYLQTLHLSQLKGTVQEYELIVNRSGLPHDLSSDQLTWGETGGRFAHASTRCIPAGKYSLKPEMR